MSEKVVIDIEARFTDHVSSEVRKTRKSIVDLEKEADQAKKGLDKLGKTTAKPKVEANTSKFEKMLQRAQQKADKLGKTKIATAIGAVDKASQVFNKINAKARAFAGKTYQGVLKIRDSNAMDIINDVLAGTRNIAGKVWKGTIKVVDFATAPLRKIKNMLFSIKGLITAITAGFATKKFIMEPINLADAYSGTAIGMKTLLGEEGGQKMMDQMDEFAKKTPFKTSGVIANAQKMMAYGWDPSRILSDLEIIGDAAAATGKGDAGLESIVYALSEIRSKGKLSTQELNQLASAGIKAKAYLAEGLGYGTSDEGMMKLAKDLEGGAIGANQAVELILQGMKEFNGMMDQTANETASGLWSQIQDTFEINIFRKWGQGLQEGAKKGLGSIVKLLNSSEEALGRLGDTLFEFGSEISNKAAEGLDKVIQKLMKVTESDAFKNASLGGKFKIVWDEVIGDPLGEWWESTGRAKVAELSGKIGKGLGEGLSNFFKGLFGISDDVGDGAVSVGASFAEGFVDGFDAKGVASSIFEAFKSFFKEHPIAGTILGGAVLGKFLSPFGGLGGIASLGKGIFNAGSVIKGSKGLADVGAGAGLAARIIGNTGTSMVGGSGISGMLAGLGFKLTGGAAASTLSGGAAAALGGGTIAGGLAGALGIGSGIKDIYRGTKASGKEAQDSYFKGGTKLGMVGAGAAVGTAILPGVGSLIGAGVGGLGALFGGNAAGKWLSDKKDSAANWLKKKYYGDAYDSETGKVDKGWTGESGGWMDTVKEIKDNWNECIDETKAFFTETIPKKWDEIIEGAKTFFTETIPEKWEKFQDEMSTFFLETLPEKMGELVGKIEVFFTETLPEWWNEKIEAIGEFFTETLPEWWNEKMEIIGTFFTETLPEWWNEKMEIIGTFFTETLPEWWNEKMEIIGTFFTETLPEWWNEKMEIIGTFFTETLPQKWEEIKETASTFFTETLPQKWEEAKEYWKEKADDIAEGWDGVKEYFKEKADAIGNWFSEKKESVKNAWSSFKESFNKGKESAKEGHNAAGGFVQGRQLSWLGEEGTPEMVIPLGSKRRKRAIDLWKKAGRFLGADTEGYAIGGMAGTAPTPATPINREQPRMNGATSGSEGNNIKIDLGGVKVEINVSEGKSIMESIDEQIDDIVDMIAERLADGLNAKFANMPVRGGA